MTKYWSETQHLAAAWFATRGWPYARPVGNGRQGADVENMPGLSPEVKTSVDKGDWTGWLRQARKEGRLGLPFVVYRPRGFGPAVTGRWVVLCDLEEFTALLRAAGYGESEDVLLSRTGRAIGWDSVKGHWYRDEGEPDAVRHYYTPTGDDDDG